MQTQEPRCCAAHCSWATTAWMVLEAAVAIAAGLAAHSLTLLAFGMDSIIELASALVLLWRLNMEIGRGEAFPEEVERRAARIGGGLLFALAAYVVASAGWSLVNRQGQEFSTAGLVLAVLAIPVMYLLARAKLDVAGKIGSRALRADAVESITCGWLSGVVIVGLAAQWALDAWWVDGVSALVLAPLLVKEAWEAWEGEGCDHDDAPQ